jgi:hypothetical protein
MCRHSPRTLLYSKFNGVRNHKDSTNGRKKRGVFIRSEEILRAIYEEMREYIVMYRDGILKLFRSPGIDSKESIPLAYVAGSPVREPYSYLVPSPHRLF